MSGLRYHSGVSLVAAPKLTLSAKLALLDIPEVADAFEQAVAFELARLDFVAFLDFVMIQEVEVNAFGERETGDAIKFELWPHLVERAKSWQSGRHEIILKARQLGLSWLAAAYALWVGLKRGAKVLLISKTEDDAFELLDKVDFIWEHLPEELKKRKEVDNEGELRFDEGGQIIALPSTTDAGRGFTATLVIADENAFHMWAQQNYKAYRPTVADKGQLLLISTGNGVGNFFHQQWEKATRAQRQLQSIQLGQAPAEIADNEAVVRMLQLALLPVFIPWFARKDRDDFWLEKERQNYVGDPMDFLAEYPATAEQAFVRLTGLVYPMFDEEKHVLAEEPVPWEQCHYRYAGYDLGGGDPNAIVILGCYRERNGYERIHQYAEFYQAGRLGAQAFLDFLLPWHEVAPFTRIECDPKDVQFEETLAAAGLPTRTANWKRQEGLGLTAMYLENGWLTIGAHCINSIHEFEGYRWLTRVDPNSKDRYATSSPFDHHGDAMDARRYALVGVYADQMNARGENWARAYGEVLV